MLAIAVAKFGEELLGGTNVTVHVIGVGAAKSGIGSFSVTGISSQDAASDWTLDVTLELIGYSVGYAVV
jgi:hypothetical protein